MSGEADPIFDAGWNAAIDAAAAACTAVDNASHGQGHQIRRPAGGGGNPHAHRSGEIGLGAMRCRTEIEALRRPDADRPEHDLRDACEAE